MRFTRLMLAASGLATVALLGSTGIANAAGTTNGPFANPIEAGYQLHSSVRFNDIRATVHIPAGSSTSPFIALQQNVNGGATAAIGLVNVGGNYFLEGIIGRQINTQTGQPLPAAAREFLVDLPTLGAPAGSPLFSNQTGGSYFLEIHYSTKRNLVQYIAGPTETDNATLNDRFSFNFSHTFNAPAVETINFNGVNLPISTPQASFTRVGVTEPSGENIKTVGGKRVTFDAFAQDESIATGDGGPVTIGNPAVLKPSPALPGVGSAFGIITGP